MDGLTIREARAGDGDACARLWVAFGAALVERMPAVFRIPPDEDLAAWFEAGIAAAGSDELRALAELDGAVVGLAHAAVRRPTDPPYPTLIAGHLETRVTLEDIVVAPEVRSLGIGEQLVRHVEEWARTQGAAEVSLHSDADGPARRFYERLGYGIQGAVYGRRL